MINKNIKKIYDLLSVLFEINNYDMEYKNTNKPILILKMDNEQYRINIEKT